MTFATLSKKDINHIITIVARIEQVHQTAGPTLFRLFDGSAHFAAKAFVKPGKRAYPDLGKGTVIQAVLRIREYEGVLEGDIVSMERSDDSNFKSQLETLKEKSIGIEHVEFLNKTSVLEKLRPSMEKAARIIKAAIYENRPIILRHNADCDGYSSAIALERAIVPLILDHHKDEFSQWRYYRRSPSKAPFYAYGDAVLDLVTATNDMLRNGLKEPLIIIADNGSGEEDLLAIRRVKTYGCQIIVVDHHFIKNDVVSPVVDVNISPYLADGDSRLCSGMLGVELAGIVNPKVEGIAFLAALSGFGDKVKPEEMKTYLELAEKEGYSEEYLKKLAACIDFEAHYLRFVEGRGVVDDLLGADKEVQEKAVAIINEEVKKRYASILHTAQHYIKIEQHGKKVIAVLDIDLIAVSGEYPQFGKITGLTSDWLKEKHKTATYVLGTSSDMIVLRVNESETGFNLNALVQELQKKFHYANISGGGHERAGTIKFVAAAKEEILAFVKEYILKVK